MRPLLLTLLLLALTACGPADDAGAPAAAEGTVDPDLVGFWSRVYTQFSIDGPPKTYDTRVTWTLREDGTALEAKQDDRLGPTPLTENLSWTRDGDRLGFTNVATGDARERWDVVRLKGDTLTVKDDERERYLTFVRGPVDE